MHPLKSVLERKGALCSSEWTLGEESAEGALFHELIFSHWYQYPDDF